MKTITLDLDMLRFAVATMREACAKVCEARIPESARHGMTAEEHEASECADAIRALANKSGHCQPYHHPCPEPQAVAVSPGAVSPGAVSPAGDSPAGNFVECPLCGKPWYAQ